MLIQFPTTKNIWCHLTNTTRYRIMEFFLVIFYHAIPGFLYDFVLKFTKNPRRLLPLYRKTHLFMVFYIRTHLFSFLCGFVTIVQYQFLHFRLNCGISWHKNGNFLMRICMPFMKGKSNIPIFLHSKMEIFPFFFLRMFFALSPHDLIIVFYFRSAHSII